MAKVSFIDKMVSPRCEPGIDPYQFLLDVYQEQGSLSKTALFFGGVDPSTISKNLKECRLMNYKPTNGNGSGNGG